jgi:hypothetical protein
LILGSVVVTDVTAADLVATDDAFVTDAYIGGTGSFSTTLTSRGDLVVLDDCFITDDSVGDTFVLTTSLTTADIVATDDVFITDAVVADELALTTTFSAGSTVSVGTKLKLTAGAVLTPTDGAAFAPASSFQPIGAAGAIGISISPSGWSSGQILVLYNATAQNIVISDTSTTMLSGDITLAQYDTLWLIHDGTNWVELGTSNN